MTMTYSEFMRNLRNSQDGELLEKRKEAQAALLQFREGNPARYEEFTQRLRMEVRKGR